MSLLLLSACRVDTAVTVQVDADGSGVVTVEAVADAAVVQKAPGLAEDLRFDDAVANGWTVDGPTATESGGLRVVLSRRFATVDEANLLLQSINGANGPLRGVSLARAGGLDADGTPDDSDSVITLTGQLGVSGGVDAFADADVLAALGASPYADDLAAAGVQPTDAVSFRLDVDVPGNVTGGGNGATVTDGVLSWTAPVDGSTLDLATTFDVSAGGAGFWSTVSTFALVLLVVWCVVAAAFIAFVVRMRTQRRLAAARHQSGRRRPPGSERRR